jgi:transposase
MGRKEKFSASDKLNAVEDYLSGKRCTSQICCDMGINKTSLYSWLSKYQMFGQEGLTAVVKNKYYPDTLKLTAIRDYLDGRASQYEICRQYQISSPSVLRLWIKEYNGHETSKSHNSQGDKNMTKGRKTTYDERIDIVAFCIANNYEYQKTAEKFQVSYLQVYTWVKKYNKNGKDALVDRRGNSKNPEEMNEMEKLTAQIKLLDAKNKRLEMENDFLKKLKEVERRG